MTDRRTTTEMAALRGADMLDNDELAARLVQIVTRVGTSPDPHEHVQNLYELAAVALTAARRLEARP